MSEYSQAEFKQMKKEEAEGIERCGNCGCILTSYEVDICKTCKGGLNE